MRIPHSLLTLTPTQTTIEITVPGCADAYGGRVAPADSNAPGSRAYHTLHVRTGPLTADC
jgi:hypothetical protein